jgi:hypothetical protein
MHAGSSMAHGFIRFMHADSSGMQHASCMPVHGCRFMHAGPCMPVHAALFVHQLVRATACKKLLMRACARRSYCKKCRVNTPDSLTLYTKFNIVAGSVSRTNGWTYHWFHGISSLVSYSRVQYTSTADILVMKNTVSLYDSKYCTT